VVAYVVACECTMRWWCMVAGALVLVLAASVAIGK
jgi:hypothetical protein